jgi:arginine N-succinyltransferase
MMIVRHAAHRDLDDIYRLAQRAGESGWPDFLAAK